MPSVALRSVNPRQRFILDVAQVVVVNNIRAFNLTQVGEGAVVLDAVANRSHTHINTPNGRISPLGRGASLAFNGTTDYLSTPDTADLTFIETATMSGFAVMNVVDTAANRDIFSKSTTSNTEYIWSSANGTDFPTFFAQDDSVAITVQRNANATLTHAVWCTQGFSYDGTGGATAMNGVTLFLNGAVNASTATNSGSYVAMEDKAAAFLIGAQNAGATNFMNGSMAMQLLVAANLSAAQHAALNALAKAYFRI